MTEGKVMALNTAGSLHTRLEEWWGSGRASGAVGKSWRMVGRGNDAATELPFTTTIRPAGNWTLLSFLRS